ncbi:hypothetical protein PTTG_25956, partial [Puccinia triticina 1-1 BBBD Race 1]
DSINHGLLGFDPDHFLNMESEQDGCASSSRASGYERFHEHIAPLNYFPADFLSDPLAPAITHNIEHLIPSSTMADEGEFQTVSQVLQPYATKKDVPTNEPLQVQPSSTFSQESFRFQPNVVGMQPFQPWYHHDGAFIDTFDPE